MITPEEIVAIVISLVIIVVGIFSIFTITSVQETTVHSSYSEQFTIVDSYVDQNIDTKQSGMSNIIVYQYNGAVWIQVDSSYVSYSGTTVIVQSGGIN